MFKKNVYLYVIITIVFAFSNLAVAQTIKFSDVIIPGSSNSLQKSSKLEKVTTTEIISELAIIAVDSGASTVLPSWYNDLVNTKIPEFFAAATFNNYNYNITVLRRNLTNAFKMPRYSLPSFNGTCEHVHLESNVLAVLRSADSLYNFANYDLDGDGKVNIHFCSIGPNSGGVTGGTCFSYLSNDTTSTGERILVNVNKQTRGSGASVFESVYYHETGHDQFDFPDIDHFGVDYYDHYGLGSFEVMSGGGFQDQPSPYTPAFRHIRNWFSPISITSSSTGMELKDFQMNSTCYIYTPSSLPYGTLANQKFYNSYHRGTETYNPLYRKYPFINSDKGGVLIWHSNTNSLNKWMTDFNDWRKMPIDIESAHGKTNWTKTSNNVINTGVENPLTGRDKLEIRKMQTDVNGV